MRFLLSVCLSFLLTLPLAAQLAITDSHVSILSGVTGIEHLGDQLVVDPASRPVLAAAVVIRVETEAANVQVEASDQSRLPVKFNAIDSKTYLFTAPGKTWVDVTAVDFDKNIFARKTVVVEIGVGPTPPGPTPPGPTPGPAPIDGLGLRVLILHESEDAAAMPTTQQDILFSQNMRGWLNENCVIGDDGKTREWRVLDDDTQFTNTEYRWAKAAKRPHATLPWIIVSNGTSGYEGPLPLTVAETKSLIEPYKTTTAPVKSVRAKYPDSDVRLEVFSDPVNCAPCRRWEAEVKPNIKWTIENKSQPFPSYVTAIPSFIVNHAGKRIYVIGSRSVDELQSVVNRIDEGHYERSVK